MNYHAMHYLPTDTFHFRAEGEPAPLCGLDRPALRFIPSTFYIVDRTCKTCLRIQAKEPGECPPTPVHTL